MFHCHFVYILFFILGNRYKKLASYNQNNNPPKPKKCPMFRLIYFLSLLPLPKTKFFLPFCASFIFQIVKRHIRGNTCTRIRLLPEIRLKDKYQSFHRLPKPKTKTTFGAYSSILSSGLLTALGAGTLFLNIDVP